MSVGSVLRREVLPFWRSWIVVLVPLLVLPLPLVSNTSEAWCAYGIIIIAAFWMTEALPMAATALLPTVLFPMFGVLSTGEVSMQYMSATNLLFLAGVIVAVGVEKSNFHTRAALRVVLTVGSSIKWLMLGFMFITMFFSMWMSNTATTAMVAPMVAAVITNLTQHTDIAEADDEETLENGTCKDIQLEIPDAQEITPVGSSRVQLSLETKPEESPPPLTEEQLRPPLYLCVAYAANCGGMGTLTGTAPNLVFRGILEQYYGTQTGLSFATFMLFGVPTMLICTVVAWCLLICVFIGPRYLLSDPTPPDRIRAVRASLQRRYDELGPIRFQEGCVVTLLVILVSLWFFRDPQFMPGWDLLFPYAEIDDGSAGMLIVTLMFIIPAEPRFWWFKKKGEMSSVSRALLEWSDVQKGVSWGILLLMGGGFAVARATTASGLSAWLADQLTVLEPLPAPLVVMFICAFTTLVTEVSSNSATASILLPVMAQLSHSLHLNPLYLMLPTVISCSFAFMLPVATPPNAIVFGAGRLRSIDMLKAGSVMNLLCVGVVMLMVHTLGVAVFDLNTYPDWANVTLTAAAPAS